MESKKAAVSVETTLQNEAFSMQNVSIHTYLTDRSGKVVATTKEQPITLNTLKEKSIKTTLLLDNPRLWNLEDPYLYRLIVEIKKGTAVIDRQVLKYGIGAVIVTKEGVILNGQKIKLLGVNNHQDHARVGSALPDYLQYYRISLLKNMGVNAYRTSHNAPTPELLEACDSLGMLVMDEQLMATQVAMNPINVPRVLGNADFSMAIVK